MLPACACSPSFMLRIVGDEFCGEDSTPFHRNLRSSYRTETVQDSAKPYIPNPYVSVPACEHASRSPYKAYS